MSAKTKELVQATELAIFGSPSVRRRTNTIWKLERLASMFADDNPSEPRDYSVEFFIGENLSIFQVQWIKTQSEALLKTKTEILEAILTEWFASNPSEDCENLQKGALARRAVGEFILRHHAEFLPVSPSRD